MKKNEKIHLTLGEMRALLFWSTVGYKNSNGGSGKNTYLRMLKKYSKKSKFNSSHFPPLNASNEPNISGKTLGDIFEILAGIYPIYFRKHTTIKSIERAVELNMKYSDMSYPDALKLVLKNPYIEKKYAKSISGKEMVKPKGE